MACWQRVRNAFRLNRLSREIDEELESHIEEAIEQGRDPSEARRAFGSMLRQREKSLDVKLIAWLTSIKADIVVGWRQLRKNKTASAAAILSLGLTIGACASAFRLVDALLLRPLPVKNPAQLYALVREGSFPDGKFQTYDDWDFPLFRRMREAVKDRAGLIAIRDAERMDLSYGSDEEMERAYLQYVSGALFDSFGLRPVLGRLLEASDDITPGAHPYAVISYDYWTRRFGRDPRVIARSFRMGSRLYEIVGVTPAPFTGTGPGTMTDIFVPTMMMPGVSHSDSRWVRVLACVKPGAAIQPIKERLEAVFRVFQEEKASGLRAMSKKQIGDFVNQSLSLEPAAAGVSGMQKEYRRALATLAMLAGLLLLIACANVANLMTAQAAARAREMAVRVSIGAGRWRLVQLVLIESAILASLSAAMGALFAWWSGPFVVGRINPPDNPARLLLGADWRVLGFGLLLTLAVTLVFGVAPALDASAVQPASVLRGGTNPGSRRRLMRIMIAVQVAFCFVVLFLAGLFVAAFERLSHLSTGFSSERLLVVDTTAQRGEPQAWDQVAERIRTVPGVESIALAAWPLLEGYTSLGFISVNGPPAIGTPAYFLNVSPGWFRVMKIPFVDGRDFRVSDTYPGAAIVNQAFARRYFSGENPIGKRFERALGYTRPLEIVGLVRDARYRDIREPMLPVAYVPLRFADPGSGRTEGTILVRTTTPNPMALASIVRTEIPQINPEFRVTNIRTQEEIDNSQTVRERLLAMLALFFASVALLLAGVGLYGVLDYSVLQRRREIGIRMAIGARPSDVAARVTIDVFSTVLVGALAGLLLGLVSVRYVETLLFEVEARDAVMLAVPAAIIFSAAILAALPAVFRAVRTDPAKILRAD